MTSVCSLLSQLIASTQEPPVTFPTANSPSPTSRKVDISKKYTFLTAFFFF